MNLLSQEFKFPQYDDVETSGESVDPNYTIRLASTEKRHPGLGLNKTPPDIYAFQEEGLELSTSGDIQEQEFPKW